MRGLGGDGFTLCGGKAGEVFELHRHTGIAAQDRFVAVEEIPVERGKGAGLRAGSSIGVKGAGAAIVAHALDVFARGDIGFGCRDAAIGELRHADGVREFDPFDGVDIDCEIPFVDLARLDAEQKGVKAGDHEALDVVSVAVCEGLGDGFAKALHGGIGSPVEGRERLVGVEGVRLGVLRHVTPVDATDVFAPAEDLADETFDSGERGLARAVAGFGLGEHFAGVEEFEIEGGGEAGVVEERLLGPHGVLIGAEEREAVVEEVV